MTKMYVDKILLVTMVFPTLCAKSVPICDKHQVSRFLGGEHFCCFTIKCKRNEQYILCEEENGYDTCEPCKKGFLNPYEFDTTGRDEFENVCFNASDLCNKKPNTGAKVKNSNCFQTGFLKFECDRSRNFTGLNPENCSPATVQCFKVGEELNLTDSCEPCKPGFSKKIYGPYICTQDETREEETSDDKTTKYEEYQSTEPTNVDYATTKDGRTGTNDNTSTSSTIPSTPAPQYFLDDWLYGIIVFSLIGCIVLCLIIVKSYKNHQHHVPVRFAEYARSLIQINKKKEFEAGSGPNTPQDDAQPNRPQYIAQPNRPHNNAQPYRPQGGAQSNRQQYGAHRNRPPDGALPSRPQDSGQPNRPHNAAVPNKLQCANPVAPRLNIYIPQTPPDAAATDQSDGENVIPQSGNTDPMGQPGAAMSSSNINPSMGHVDRSSSTPSPSPSIRSEADLHLPAAVSSAVAPPSSSLSRDRSMGLVGTRNNSRNMGSNTPELPHSSLSSHSSVQRQSPQLGSLRMDSASTLDVNSMLSGSSNGRGHQRRGASQRSNSTSATKNPSRQYPGSTSNSSTPSLDCPKSTDTVSSEDDRAPQRSQVQVQQVRPFMFEPLREEELLRGSSINLNIDSFDNDVQSVEDETLLKGVAAAQEHPVEEEEEHEEENDSLLRSADNGDQF